MVDNGLYVHNYQPLIDFNYINISIVDGVSSPCFVYMLYMIYLYIYNYIYKYKYIYIYNIIQCLKMGYAACPKLPLPSGI